MSKIDIIVPMYNVKGYLPLCIASVINQTFKDFSLILVDDGSTDGSGEICDKYKQIDSRIRVVHHERNTGVSSAREDGYGLSNAEWLCFLDGDDAIAPNYLQTLWQYVDSGADMIAMECQQVPDNQMEREWEESQLQYVEKPQIFEDIACFAQVYAGKGTLSTAEVLWCKLIRRDLLEASLEFTRKHRSSVPKLVFEDTFLCPQIWLRARKVLVLRAALYRHRCMIASSLGHTLSPSEYHYNMIPATRILLEQLNEYKEEDFYYSIIKHSFMQIEKIWYMAVNNEKDKEKREFVTGEIDKMIGDYKRSFTFHKEHSVRDYFIKISSMLFCLNKTLWVHTVGSIYFGHQKKKWNCG